MSARRLDGKALAEERRDKISREVRALTEGAGQAPRLAAVLASEDGGAATYAAVKEKAARALGIEMSVIRIPGPTTASLIDAVRRLARDDGVDGILIESPVASGIDLRQAQDEIPLDKDIDGASTASLGRLFSGRPGFVPATAAAVLSLLDGYEIGVAGCRAVVVGRSLVVGRPLAQLLLGRDATITVCHSRTKDLALVVREADLVCMAVGRPRLLTGSMVKPGAVVIDVGTNLVDGKLVGDVDYESVAEVAGAISPVPGGVGPLTTLLLLESVARAAHRRLSGLGKS